MFKSVGHSCYKGSQAIDDNQYIAVDNIKNKNIKLFQPLGDWSKIRQ